MKTISVAVLKEDYEVFRRAARRLRRPVAQLIREAMSHYRAEYLDPHPPLREVRVLVGHRLKGELPSRAELWDEIHGDDIP